MSDDAGSTGTEHEPDYRFSLANERTFLAWIRTSLALLVAGIALVQLVPRFGGRYVLGELLVLLAVLTAVASIRRYDAVRGAMRRDLPLPGFGMPRLLAVGLFAIAVAAVLLLALTR